MVIFTDRRLRIGITTCIMPRECILPLDQGQAISEAEAGTFVPRAISSGNQPLVVQHGAVDGAGVNHPLNPVVRSRQIDPSAICFTA